MKTLSVKQKTTSGSAQNKKPFWAFFAQNGFWYKPHNSAVACFGKAQPTGCLCRDETVFNGLVQEETFEPVPRQQLYEPTRPLPGGPKTQARITKRPSEQHSGHIRSFREGEA